MDKRSAKNNETQASTVNNNSTWSPHMDGIPEPSPAEQAKMDACSASYESRRFKAFQEICPNRNHQSSESRK
ncbi:hypothetical protein PTKIN_Ptkin08bG0157800 [Pterospermum kingtungense]